MDAPGGGGGGISADENKFGGIEGRYALASGGVARSAFADINREVGKFI